MNHAALVRTLVTRFPAVVPHLKSKARALANIKADLSSINGEYHDAITEALTTYFEGGSVTGPRNAFTQAMVEAFGDAFEAGWEDGGGELPFDGDALTWFNERVEEERGHIASVFDEAKDLRGDQEFDFFSWISARADGYVSTLQSIYNAALMMADKRQMLTWHLGSTEKHCKTCLKLDGQRHRASWYISRNYIPRQPDAAMDCKGYNCDCSLTDDEGNEVTV